MENREKKTAVITIRTTEDIGEWIEERAEKKGWTKAKMAEYMLTSYIYGKEDEETEEAKEVYSYIKNTNCNSMSDLIKWGLIVNKFNIIGENAELWQILIEEKNKSRNNTCDN